MPPGRRHDPDAEHPSPHIASRAARHPRERSAPACGFDGRHTAATSGEICKPPLMRLRRPVIAASALGLAGALLPTSGAVAATDQTVTFSEEVTYQDRNGSSVTCDVNASLYWTLGGEGPEDDTLTAYTSGGAGSCRLSSIGSVTLRWSMDYYRHSLNHSHTAEGNEGYAAVTADPPSQFSEGYRAVSSEHRVVFGECSSNCVWTHTITPK